MARLLDDLTRLVPLVALVHVDEDRHEHVVQGEPDGELIEDMLLLLRPARPGARGFILLLSLRYAAYNPPLVRCIL